MKRLAFICAAAAVVLTFSCTKETVTIENSKTVTDEVIQKVESLELNSSTIEFSSIELPDGMKKDVYLIEGCIAIDPANLDKMSLHDGISGEQYRTYNLVSAPRTINVIGYTGSGNALTTKMKTALRWAVDNYNALNLTLRFNLSFGTNYQSKDIVVYRTQNNKAGGVAGFPSGGKPYKWVQIFSPMENYNTNVIEHVMSHEIGHCLGMRHSDWFSRRSCGGSGEPRNPSGAVHIPGTPTGYDGSSLMNACFPGNSNGEFNTNDRRALKYIY